MDYDTLREEMLQGWNTFDTYSVLSHVRLPEGFAIRLGLKHRVSKRVLQNALIGRFGAHEEHIKPGLRTVDGSYTELRLEWLGAEIEVRSCADEHGQYILVEPKNEKCREMILFMECGFLWNKHGAVYAQPDHVQAVLDNGEIRVYMSDSDTRVLHTPGFGVVRASDLNGAVAVSTGAPLTPEQVRARLEKARAHALEAPKTYGKLEEAYTAMRTGYAWNTIYDPENRRICSPVSRIWNVNWGGYVLFEWDTFFCALMAAPESKELAYANVFAILNEATERGFIPNFGAAGDNKSRDRTEPPVGAMTVRELYRRFGMERVWEQYHYTRDLTVLRDARRAERAYARMIREDGDTLTKLLGFEASQMGVDGHYDLENDWPALFYYYGDLGFALYAGFVLAFLLRALRALLRDFRGSLTPLNFTLLLCVSLQLGLAQYSGALLRRPNVSIYLSLALALLWYQTREKEVHP